MVHVLRVLNLGSWIPQEAAPNTYVCESFEIANEHSSHLLL